MEPWIAIVQSTASSLLARPRMSRMISTVPRPDTTTRLSPRPQQLCVHFYVVPTSYRRGLFANEQKQKPSVHLDAHLSIQLCDAVSLLRDADLEIGKSFLM